MNKPVYQREETAPNPFPVPEGDHPVLDELIDVGAMSGTTIRQMKIMANALTNHPELYDGRTLGLATGVVYLVDRIEELTSP